MTLPDRKEAEVRRLLEAPAQPLPPDLADRALALGTRRARRRHLAQLAACALLITLLLASTIWLLATEPWTAPPPATTPTGGW